MARPRRASGFQCDARWDNPRVEGHYPLPPPARIAGVRACADDLRSVHLRAVSEFRGLSSRGFAVPLACKPEKLLCVAVESTSAPTAKNWLMV